MIVGVCATKLLPEKPATCFTEGNWGGGSKRYIILEDIQQQPGSGDITEPRRAGQGTTPFLEFYTRPFCAQ